MATTTATPLQVIVTGGSRGIGKACVEAFASQGHRVLFTYASNFEAAHAFAQQPAWEGRVYATKLDQGDFLAVQAFAAFAEGWREGRPIDVVINNAALGSATVTSYTGVLHGDAAETASSEAELSARQDVDLLRVNALGPMWITQQLLPMLKRESGRSVVLFIGSVGGGSQSVLFFPGARAADLMSKAALAYLVKLLAAEHASNSHLDFLCLSPGAVNTEMFQKSTLDTKSDSERAAFLQQLPKGRLIEPEEIAETVYWLTTCSAARIFNGACLDASQGLAVRPGMLTEQSSK